MGKICCLLAGTQKFARAVSRLTQFLAAQGGVPLCRYYVDPPFVKCPFYPYISINCCNLYLQVPSLHYALDGRGDAGTDCTNAP